MTASRKFTIVFAVVTMGGLAGLIAYGEMNAPASLPQSATKLVTPPATPPATQTQTVQTRTPEPVVEARTPEQQVVDQMIDRYRIVVESGTYTDMCAQAGFVKAAYLQAGDNAGYSSWIQVERGVCGNLTLAADKTIGEYSKELGAINEGCSVAKLAEEYGEDYAKQECEEEAKHPVQHHSVKWWHDYLVKCALTGVHP
jgi:hypothetical protein